VSIFDFLGGLIKPVTDLIGKVITKDEDRAKVQGEIDQIKNALAVKMMEYEMQIAQMRSNVIIAETTAQSWITRSWRPIAMLTFLTIIVYQGIFVSIFKLPPVDYQSIPAEMWTLLTVGIGGYIAGRSVEQIFKAKE
jgi:hypothetical protein